MNLIMFKSEKVKEIKRFGKYLFFILVLLIALSYITMNGDVTITDDTLRNAWKKPNFFQSHIEDLPKENTTSTSESKTKYPEAELDIKFLFIGAKKCGTTAFRTFVSNHPDIITSNPPCMCKPQPQTLNSIKGAQEFLKLANKTNKVALVAKNKCLHNIREFDRLKKPPKIVVLLCDPTLRAYSDYKEIFFSEGLRPIRPFEVVVPEAISVIEPHTNDEDFAHYLSRFTYEEHLDYSMVSVGFYYVYLKEYYKRYNPEDILILSGAELKQNPYLAMHQLESFLGVRHYLDKSKFVRNEANGMYCVRKLSGETKCIRPHARKFKSPGEATIEKLRQLYRPYNENLFRLLNRTFSWL